MADKEIIPTGGVYGYTDLQAQGWFLSFPAEASAAITGPAVVTLSSTLTVATAATDGTASLARGIALESVASGNIAQVVVAGLVENMPVDGATAAGSLLKRSVTTAGRLAATATPVAGEVLAIALAASSSNTTDVWVVGLGSGLS
jgi:hypothetical protein